MMFDYILIVLARVPIPGKVKTRLAAAVGAEQAAALHEAMLMDLLTRFVRESDVPMLLTIAADDDPSLCESLLRRYRIPKHRVQVVPGWGGMNEDIAHSYGYALQLAREAALIGADIPYYTPAQCRRLFRALDGVDVAFHPNVDDGCCPHALSVPLDLWTGNDSRQPGYILRFTRQLKSLGLHWRTLEPLWDIDEPRDLFAFRGWMSALSRNDHAFCPRTLATIRRTLPLPAT